MFFFSLLAYSSRITWAPLPRIVAEELLRCWSSRERTALHHTVYKVSSFSSVSYYLYIKVFYNAENVRVEGHAIWEQWKFYLFIYFLDDTWTLLSSPNKTKTSSSPWTFQAIISRALSNQNTPGIHPSRCFPFCWVPVNNLNIQIGTELSSPSLLLPGTGGWKELISWEASETGWCMCL